jgi:hypothetical protein
MKAKTLLIAAAALAAGVISSQAQTPVYSQNIVGYANVSLPSGYTLLANPLSAGVSNGVTEAISPAQLPVGATILIFNGVGYNQSQYAPGYNSASTVFIDPDSGNDVPTPVIPPGVGFFVQNPSSATNLTFVGSVYPAPGTTNATSLPSGYSLVGSALPLAGSLTNSAINLNLVVGATVLIFNGVGYNQAQYAPGYNDATTVFIDPDSGNNIATPALQVGQGFFYQNPGSGVTWSQTLPNN